MSGLDDRWLENLYKDQYKTVYLLVRHRLPYAPTEDIHDIVQETFLLAFQKHIINHAEPIAWLYVTARNLCKNYIRKYQRQLTKMAVLKSNHLASQPAGVYDSATYGETDTVDAMLTLKSELSEADYELVEEICLKGTPIEEVSSRTGLTVNSIRVRMHRIRQKLKTILMVCVILFILNKIGDLFFLHV